MENKYKKEQKIFRLLGHVPGGLTIKDLRLKTEEKKEANADETFYGNWEGFI